MAHSSRQGRLTRHLAVFGFFALSLLLFTGEMSVVRSGVPPATGGPPNNLQLTLKKHHEPNPGTATWQIGVPITYVITVSNPQLTPISNIEVKDTLPPGFVFIDATCTVTVGAAVCPSNPLPPPVGGVHTTTPITIPFDGEVEIRITGYYKTSGPKNNGAVATAGSLPVGNTNTDHDPVNVPATPLPADIKVEKLTTSNSSIFPAAIHYIVRVTNNTTTPVYLGGIMTINDVITNDSFLTLNWSASGFSCNPSLGAECPDLPPAATSGTLLAANNATLQIQYDKPGSSPSNDAGLLPGGAAYEIQFDVAVTTPATCLASAVTFKNQAFLDLSNGTTSIGDQNNANNTTQLVGTDISGLPACPPSAVASKRQLSPANNTANWNSPVTYEVKVFNPTTGTLSNIPLKDYILKDSGTPTFTATVTSGPTCVSGCTVGLTSITAVNPTVQLELNTYSLWTAILPSLGAQQVAVIEFTVTYAPVCETNPKPDRIHNSFSSGTTNAGPVITDLPEWQLCQLEVKKRKITSDPIIFEQPFEYEVVYNNLATIPILIGTLRDVLSMSGTSYANSLPFDYTVSCTATAGTVTPLPAPSNVTGATAKHEALAWIGVKLIDQQLVNFGAASAMTCKVIVTVHRPKDDNPFCMGAGTPRLVNSAFMDISSGYNPGDHNQPGFYDSKVADLPLCRKVNVTKTTPQLSVGPGATVVYKITVENKGDNPVSNLTLSDVIQPPFVPAVSVSQCNPPTACTVVPALNSAGSVATVTYGPLQPNQPVSFDLTVNAPQAGGSYTNLAVGAFIPLPGENFYFQGEEDKLLQQEENIQVVTPILTKSFDPATIGPNGTSTLIFTITNTPSDPDQNGINFSDTLPPGLLIDSVVLIGCDGAVNVSPDGRTLILAGGKLIKKHSCQIIVKVKATGVCGVFPNNKDNFSNVKNLDVSHVKQQLEVTGCETGLVITKKVEGAPAGFTGQFNFLVQCSTLNGFYQKAVTVSWPTPGFTALNDIPAGSQCTVTEGPPPSTLPAGYNWSGLPAYSPAGGFVAIGDKGGQITVIDKMAPCEEAGRVKITKVIKGVPKDFAGVFEGTLQCWVAGKLVTYPVTLTAPNGLTTTVNNIPLGSTCTFKETGLPPLSGDLQWLPPDYTPEFGTVTLSGQCCQEITLVNQAKHCCTPNQGASDGTVLKPESSTSHRRPTAGRVGRLRTRRRLVRGVY